MHLGIRTIRSAGRTSGSIEITLPTQLQVLEGLDCRMQLRDGGQPEIILQPDLTAAHRLIRDLWGKVRLGLGEIGDIGDFSPSDFTLMLFQPEHWQERPPLVYADALRVLSHREGATENLTSLIAALSIASAHRLDLVGALGLGFADALTYLATGSTSGLGADFERGMAHQVMQPEQDPRRSAQAAYMPGSPFEDQTWISLRPAARRLFEQFRKWHLDPATYTAARENWYRAFTAEINLNMSLGSLTDSVSNFLLYADGITGK